MAVQFTTGNDQSPLIICGVDPSSADLDNFWAGGGTWMAWIRLDSAPSVIRLCGKEPDDGSEGWGLSTFGGSENQFGVIHSFATGRQRWRSPVGSILVDTMYHIAMVWNGTLDDPVFYIDGLPVVVTETSSGTGAIAADAPYPLYIGNRGNLDRGMDGTIDDVRMYTDQKTAEDILTIYTLRGRPGPLGNLLRRWPLGPHVLGLAANTPYSGQDQVTNTGASTVAVPVPSEANDGDLLVMVGFAGGEGVSSPTFTTPSGWTSRQYLSIVTSISSPAIEVFTRVASSEPSTYDLETSETTAMIGYMYSLPGVADSVDVVTTDTGFSSTPSTPTATPTVNCAVLRVMAFDGADDIPARPYDVFPGDLSALTIEAVASGSNGGGMAVAIETSDDTATGANSWTIVGTEEWGGITICFPFGDGTEGLPLKDLSNAQAHAISYGHMVMGTSELVVSG